MRQPFICLECAKVTNGRCAEHTLLTVGMMATPDVYPLVRAEQWLTDPRWHDGVIAQIIRDLAQEVRDLLASLQQEDLHRLLTWFEPGVSSRIPPASEVIAHLEAQTAALRQLMHEAAGVLALAEGEFREAIGNTNLAVFKLRIEEAGQALSARRTPRDADA